MSSYAPARASREVASVQGSRAVLTLFTAALFLSALLLFGVQPMFTKMVLPVLGGTPAVWSVAMVFFQALLLAGYLYAHCMTRLFSIRTAGAVHLALMGCALLAMPVAVAAGWGAPPASGEAFWLLGLFGASVGLPFFALAGNGPLLQAWFARSNHAQAKDPYFLYAGSNIGSFAALIAYPLVIEPFLSLREQSAWWMIGFGVLAAVIAICALVTVQNHGRLRGLLAHQTAESTTSVTWRDRLAWVGLSFVPSGLLVAVTAHISTDIAAAPLLWVAPLALFLLTFVLAFRDPALIDIAGLRRVQVWGTAVAILSSVSVSLSVGLALHLGLFFLNALLCHAALYRRRPPASRLTDFYLCMSLGGVLGGVFCGLLAPRLFSTVLEYPILLIAALLCHPSSTGIAGRVWIKDGGRMSLACAAALLVGAFATMLVWPALVAMILLVAFGVVTAAVWRAPQRVAPAAIAAALSAMMLHTDPTQESFRSFFGVHKVGQTEDGRFVTLAHGTTLHGAMRVKNDDGTPTTGRPELTSYYVQEGAIGSAIAYLREAQGGMLPSVAAIGLGTGTLSCQIAPNEAWTFFEIDPVVLRLATDPKYFRFLRDCGGGNVPIVLGDARLTLADQPGGKALIVVDAFSSDAIPSHLLTKEAIGLYLSKLTSDGALLFHISNRHLDVRYIVARAAAEHGLVTYVRTKGLDGPLGPARAGSIVAMVAREPADLGRLAADAAWQRVEPDMRRRPWTDDFSNIVQAIMDNNRR